MVTDNGKGKHQQTASCEAKFVINEKQPPSSSVAAAEAKQPPVSPAPASQPQSAQATLAVVAPGKAPEKAPEKVEAVKKFGTTEFRRDAMRPNRIDNEAKAELDRYADALALQPDVVGVVVGYAGPKENKDNKVRGSASQRAVNAKYYVTHDKGIDPARIEPRTGSGDGHKADLWIVPAGTKFAVEGTTVVDESKVKAAPRLPLHKKARRRHAKKRHTGPAKANRDSSHRVPR